MMPVDTIFGALLTLVAAGIMYAIGPRVIALAAPVLVNAFGVAAMLAVMLDLPYWASVALGRRSARPPCCSRWASPCSSWCAAAATCSD